MDYGCATHQAGREHAVNQYRRAGPAAFICLSGEPEMTPVVEVSTVHGDSALRTQLHRIWNNPPGLLGQLMSVNHQTIGLRYIVTALMFFAMAGLEALTMRAQLARPDNHVVSPDLYNQIF